MAEKKRKVLDPSSNTSHIAKKPKKSSNVGEGNTIVSSNDQAEKAAGNQKETIKQSKKKQRKRAVDFLDEEDGANGVDEHSEDEGVTISTTKQPKKNSLMAEAERTQDQELAEEFGNVAESDSEDIDATPALLAGFDSDNDDPAEDKDFDASRIAPIPQFKKTSKKLRKAKESKNEGPGAVYVGRVPHGFYEQQMREYFSQFGPITRLRLSRNKKTGASKHFAFIEFDSDEVAKIVAETMDNYLMFGHILKCKHAPQGTLHPDVWKGANKKFRKIPNHKLVRERAEKPKTEKQIAKKLSKEKQKRANKAKVLEAMGYEFHSPELKKPMAEKEDETKEPTNGQSDVQDRVEGALVPPPTVPKDELAVKLEEDAVKKSKKSRKAETVPSATEQKSAIDDAAPVTKRGKRDSGRPATDQNADTKPTKTQKAKTKPEKEVKKLKGILKKSTKA